MDQEGASIAQKPSIQARPNIQPQRDDTPTAIAGHTAQMSETPVENVILPPYSESALPSALPGQSVKRTPWYPGLPHIDYGLYSPPLAELSADCTTLSTQAPDLSTTSAALVSFIRAQCSIPPKPQVQVVGRRGQRIDFSIKLNLMSLIFPEDAQRRIDYIRCVSDDEMAFRGGFKPDVVPTVGDGGLEEWCRRFVQETGSVKSFALDRVVANLDTEWIEGQLRSLVATTGYGGVIAVSFPVSHARVVVQSPDKVNKLFTTVTALFAGRKKYEVVQAVWPFATARNGAGSRMCLVQSEETWWSEWKAPIRHAVVTRRRGWVTNEDKLEALMEGKGNKDLGMVDWGPDYN